MTDVPLGAGNPEEPDAGDSLGLRRSNFTPPSEPLSDDVEAPGGTESHAPLTPTPSPVSPGDHEIHDDDELAAALAAEVLTYTSPIAVIPGQQEPAMVAAAADEGIVEPAAVAAAQPEPAVEPASAVDSEPAAEPEPAAKPEPAAQPESAAEKESAASADAAEAWDISDIAEPLPPVADAAGFEGPTAGLPPVYQQETYDAEAAEPTAVYDLGAEPVGAPPLFVPPAETAAPPSASVGPPSGPAEPPVYDLDAAGLQPGPAEPGTAQPIEQLPSPVYEEPSATLEAIEALEAELRRRIGQSAGAAPTAGETAVPAAQPEEQSPPPSADGAAPPPAEGFVPPPAGDGAFPPPYAEAPPPAPPILVEPPASAPAPLPPPSGLLPPSTADRVELPPPDDAPEGPVLPAPVGNPPTIDAPPPGALPPEDDAGFPFPVDAAPRGDAALPPDATSPGDAVPPVAAPFDAPPPFPPDAAAPTLLLPPPPGVPESREGEPEGSVPPPPDAFDAVVQSAPRAEPDLAAALAPVVPRAGLTPVAHLPAPGAVEQAGLEPTPVERRAARSTRQFWTWFAVNSSVVMLATGSTLLAAGMSLRQAIVGTLIGLVLSFIPLGLGSLAGTLSGQPALVVSRATFGHSGNLLPVLISLIARVFWGGALLWMFATAVAHVLIGASIATALGEQTLALIALGVGVVIVIVVSVLGYGLLARLQGIFAIVALVTVVAVVALTASHLDIAQATSFKDAPWLPALVFAAVTVFSVVGVPWAQSAGDLARYQGPRSGRAPTALLATLGATLAPLVLVSWGAMLVASDPAFAASFGQDPLGALAALLPSWYPSLLIAAAGIGLLSGSGLSAYSGGFAIQALGVKTSRPIGAVIAGVLMAALAAYFVVGVAGVQQLVSGLAVTLAVPIAAWIGIFTAELVRRRRVHAPSLLARGGAYPDFRAGTFLLLLVASGLGLGLVTSPVAGFGWEGYLWRALGVTDGLAASQLGVIVALVAAFLVTLLISARPIARQERAAVAAVEREEQAAEDALPPDMPDSVVSSGTA